MCLLWGGGSLIVAMPGARAAGAAQYTIELTGSNGTTQSKTLAGGTSVQFDDLAPDTYSISVKGRDDAGTLVFSGTATATVIAGETASVTVELQNELGSLTVNFSGASATTATSLTVTLTGLKSTPQSKTITGGTSVQFEDLVPDTYSISVKGMDDAGTLVFSGTATATVIAGETATVAVPLQSSFGELTVDFEGAESDSVTKYTVILSGPNEFKETKEVTTRTVQFEGLIPGDYTVSVEGKNGSDVVVLAGTSSKIPVEAGKTATTKVPLENLLGSLTLNFSGARVSTATTLTVTLIDSDGASSEKTSSGEAVQFDDLVPDTYTISVKGNNDSGLVVLYGTSSATVEAGKTASTTVELVEGISDFASLQAAVAAGGTVYIFESIDVETTLSVPSGISVTILPAYQDVTLKNTSTGNLFTFPSGSTGNLTIGGGEYIITLDGNQVAQSIISMSGGTATLADNGIITNAAASGIKISSSGTFEMTGGEISKNKESSTSYGGGGVTISGGTFNMTGGEISNNESSTYNGGGGITISGGIFNMTGGRIIDNTGSQSSGGVTVYSATFNMTGGTITDNTGSFGGAVSLVSGTFDMSGGSITGNTATSSGGGVSVSGGNFNMSGSAVVDSNNDVYLITGKTINITSTLTGTAPVATITLETSLYVAGTQVLSLGNYTSEVSKFAVTPNGAESWKISTDGTLVKDEGL